MDWFKDKNRRTGVLVTVGAHLLLILLLSFILMEPPFPPPPQLGVEVNLGNSNQGMNEKQPETPEQQSSRTSSTPEKVEKIATQNTEESINIKKKTEDKKIDKKEPKDPVIDQTFTFNRKNKSGGSQGNTNTPGDQGNENGDPNASNYVGDGGSGGISFELSGRKNKKLVRPEQVTNIEGKVVVKIWVNKYGKVVNAKQEVGRSTTTNPIAVKRAINSALNSTFNSDPSALEVQTGFITYIFTF
jgi:outer membrane biosynthesis protein TonB